MSPRTTRPAIKIRYYLWADGQMWRISNQLMIDLIDHKAHLPQHASTIQKIIEVSVEQQFERALIQSIQGTAFAFDHKGALDLSDQADAISAVLNKPVTQGNVLDIQPLIRGRHWVAKHTWHPSPELVRTLESDLRAELTNAREKRLPSLKPAKPPPS